MLPILTALLLQLPAPSVAPVHSFQFVGAAETAMFVEDTTLTTEGDTKRFWVVGVLNPNSQLYKSNPGAYTMSNHVVDCRANTDAIAHLTVYGADGAIFGERDNPYPMHQVAPMSSGELIANYVCKNEISTDRTNKMHSLAEVKQFGEQWQRVMDKAQSLGLVK